MKKMEHELPDLQGPQVLQIPKVSQYRDQPWQHVLHIPNQFLSRMGCLLLAAVPLPPAFIIYHFDNIMYASLWSFLCHGKHQPQEWRVPAEST